MWVSGEFSLVVLGNRLAKVSFLQRLPSYVPDATISPKMTKNAWTFYPESANVRAVLQRLDDYRTFVKHVSMSSCLYQYIQ